LTSNPFDRLARFYDWEHAELLDDLPLYLGLASRVGGPILDAACGSGRLTLPLARAGYEVVGLDSSAAMLALAQAALGGDGELAARVRLVEAELQAAELGRRFGLVLVGLDSFGLLTEQEEQLRVLERLGRHLKRKGLLVLDLSNGNLRGGEPAEETTMHRAGRLEDGRQIVKWVARRTDHGRQLDQLIHLYDETGLDGVVRRTVVELELRYFARFELELLLERAGFVVEAVFGDYDLSPFGSASERLIVVAHVR
jgi:SAM-dependent methyltransferase